MKIEEYLQLDASLYPDKVALVCDGQSVTYSELWNKVNDRAKAYSKKFPPRMVLAIRTTQSVDFVVTYFAAHLAGLVALPLEKDISVSRFEEIQARYAQFTPPGNVADILFTTGTTGKSKGVMIGHDTIIADAENLVEALGFSHDLLFVISGPLNHIGSLSKLYPSIMVGATIYILESLKNLEAFFEAFEYPCEKAATFLVPASIRILLQIAKKQLGKLSHRIDFIEAGAAPLPHSDMIELCKVLPNTRLFNTYASTETGIIATYNFNDGECLPGCLGHAMKHSRFFLTDDGRVACQGRTLMKGYADDEELTLQVMHDNTVFTADNGTIDEKGRLYLHGRNDDVINIGGYKIAPSEVEDAALDFPGVKDCICICDKSSILGNRLKLLVVCQDGAEFTYKELAEFIASRLERFKVPQTYEAVTSIERTFNGKLNRKYYL